MKNEERTDVDYFFGMFEKVPLLSASEEIELANKVKNGDKKAKWHFICANVGLLVEIVEQYKEKLVYTSFSEALYAGLAGLVRAVNDFDPKKGFRFSTYASWWIKNGIFNAIENGDIDESFDSMLFDDDGDTRINSRIEEDTFSESVLHDIDFRVDFDRALSHLKPIEAKIFRLHNGFTEKGKCSFSEVAQLVGLGSRQRANQIYNDAKKKLEQPELACYYANYFDSNYNGGSFSFAA